MTLTAAQLGVFNLSLQEEALRSGYTWCPGDPVYIRADPNMDRTDRTQWAFNLVPYGETEDRYPSVEAALEHLAQTAWQYALDGAIVHIDLTGPTLGIDTDRPFE